MTRKGFHASPIALAHSRVMLRLTFPQDGGHRQDLNPQDHPLRSYPAGSGGFS